VSDELSIPRSPIYRVPRRSGPEPLTRRLMLIAGGLTGALVLIVALWSSVGHHGGAVPVVQADRQPVRVKPANPGGMQIPGLSTDIGTGDASDADKLAPAPETPDPQALARQAPPAPPVNQAAAIHTAEQALATRTATPPTPPVIAPAQRIVAAAQPTPPIATPSSSAAKPAQVAAAMPEQRAAPSTLRTPAGGTQVQLAAVTTEAAARHEWTRLVHSMPGVFSHHRPVFSKIEHDGRTLWRLRTGDFASESEATQFCDQLRAKGAGCAVAAF
jgi:hypothetical protein